MGEVLAVSGMALDAQLLKKNEVKPLELLSNQGIFHGTCVGSGGGESGGRLQSHMLTLLHHFSFASNPGFLLLENAYFEL